LLALIAAFGLILTGCPDANTEEKKVPTPTDVRVTPGSHGYALEDTIIGLTADGTTKYVVRVNNGDTWYGVKDDGTLDTSAADTKLATALTAAAPLNNTAGAEVTTITGLSKGTTYSVYVDATAVAVDNGEEIGGSGADVDTGGKNAIVKLDSGLAADETVGILAGAGGAGSSLVVITDNDDTQFAEGAGAVTAHTRIRGKTAAKVSTYQFSAVSGAANLEAVGDGAAYFIIKDINAAFAATITATAPVATTKLAAGSQGGAAAASIGTLTAAAKYVAQWRGNWYPLTATGLGAKAVDLVAAAQAALTGAAIGGTEATGLTNDEIYNVFMVKALETTQAIPTNLPNNAKNAIADVSALANDGKTFKLAANSGAASPNQATLYFIIKEPIASVSGTSFTSGTALTLADSLVVQCANIKYTTSSIQNGGAGTTITATVGDRFFKVISGIANLTITFTTGV
jgi:hypothetical protein